MKIYKEKHKNKCQSTDNWLNYSARPFSLAAGISKKNTLVVSGSAVIGRKYLWWIGVRLQWMKKETSDRCRRIYFGSWAWATGDCCQYVTIRVNDKAKYLKMAPFFFYYSEGRRAAIKSMRHDARVIVIKRPLTTRPVESETVVCRKCSVKSQTVGLAVTWQLMCGHTRMITWGPEFWISKVNKVLQQEMNIQMSRFWWISPIQDGRCVGLTENRRRWATHEKSKKL